MLLRLSTAGLNINVSRAYDLKGPTKAKNEEEGAKIGQKGAYED